MARRLHILGICGTFMGSLAVLARQLGFEVSGCDAQVYPPMSDYLSEQGIEIHAGYDAEQLKTYQPDMIVVGNVVSRGMPVLEAILNQNVRYFSGPEWLSQYLLLNKWVLVAAGTHGKTTTASMLAWILAHAGYAPGFLIGGIPSNFSVSSRLGSSDFFVVEGDEYDTAFFDKRSKFVHYRPRTLILNNLEFDHADIFDNIEAIEKQFHHLVRIVPDQGSIIYQANQPHLQRVLDQGCWSPCQTFGGADAEWQAQCHVADGSRFAVLHQGQIVGEVDWPLLGQHNIENALASVAAARHVGIRPELACQALSRFKGVKRRLELRGEPGGVRVYDDFAHHPTAIATTLQGLRAHLQPVQRLLAVLEPRSNTMRRGLHGQRLAESLQQADHVYFYQPNGDVCWQHIFAEMPHVQRYSETQTLLEQVVTDARTGDVIVVMSNGGFERMHARLLDALATQH